MAVATRSKPWTIDELQRLPDDGNKYEVLDGELFVTPAPSEQHELILARLDRFLVPFVASHGLGHVLSPRAVVRTQGSELEPDRMVRPPRTTPAAKDWDDAPVPILVVEVMSPTTRRRDRGKKRDFYRRIGVAEYWIVDPQSEALLVARPDASDAVVTDVIVWHPVDAADSLTIPVRALFHD